MRRPPEDGRARLARGLTREGFDALLAQLGGDREGPQRYEEIRRRLIRLFEWRDCGAPEDLADETIDRVARRLAGGLVVESGDPYRYFCGVAHRVYLEVLRERRRERRALERESWTPPAPPEDEESPERLACLRRCLARLSPEQTALILDYHREDRGAGKIEARKRLAGRLGLPMNALRIRAHRIRRGLEGCIGGCLEETGSRWSPAPPPA